MGFVRESALIGRLSRRAFVDLLISGTILARCGSARAETYPVHAIRVIVPFPAGGGVDTIARILKPAIERQLGQPLVVENKPGAASILGTELVARAAPDGYTLLFCLNPHIVNAFLYKTLPYDPLRSFAPVSLIATTPNILVVNPSVKAGSVKELIALAKAHPGTLNYGSAGLGSPFHLAGALFDVMAGVDIVHVPYKGGPQATLGLLSGQIQIMFGNLFNVLPYLKNHQLRALAVTSSKRLDVMPDLPTIAEAGVPGYEFSSWFGMLVPANTPADIVERLHAALQHIVESADVKKNIATQGAELVGSTPQEFADFLKRDMAKWAEVVPKAGLRPQ